MTSEECQELIRELIVRSRPVDWNADQLGQRQWVMMSTDFYNKILSLGTFGWTDPHPHPQCTQCTELGEASHRELTLWLVDNYSESKQVLAEKLLKTFKVEKR